ncbi:hypothetical protein [Leucobacter salsicius]|uniref:hypothetical protein n=1 Tax=Leucobacter salsicius TaxID=664638 RepID=UPI00034D5372|nr:hypothetical protein [Leucobacter salsicius]
MTTNLTKASSAAAEITYIFKLEDIAGSFRSALLKEVIDAIDESTYFEVIRSLAASHDEVPFSLLEKMHDPGVTQNADPSECFKLLTHLISTGLHRLPYPLFERACVEEVVRSADAETCYDVLTELGFSDQPVPRPLAKRALTLWGSDVPDDFGFDVPEAVFRAADPNTSFAVVSERIEEILDLPFSLIESASVSDALLTADPNISFSILRELIKADLPLPYSLIERACSSEAFLADPDFTFIVLTALDASSADSIPRPLADSALGIWQRVLTAPEEVLSEYYYDCELSDLYEALAPAAAPRACFNAILSLAALGKELPLPLVEEALGLPAWWSFIDDLAQHYDENCPDSNHDKHEGCLHEVLDNILVELADNFGLEEEYAAHGVELTDILMDTCRG